MRDWLEAIPNLSVPGVPGVNAEQSEAYDASAGVLACVPGVLEHPAGTPRTPSGTPTLRVTPLKSLQEHREHREHLKRATIESVSEAEAALLLREWHGHLSGLDQFKAPTGFTLDAWLKLTDTALWLYESHAGYAVRNGWQADDLFGVRPGYPERGGLADLLNGARYLKLSGGKAYWSAFGAPFSIGIGIGRGCVPLWELHK